MQNPYSYNRPGTHYVGNEELRQQVIEGLVRRREHFAIVGGRRCGKSSTLDVLKDDLKPYKSFLPLLVEPGEFQEVSPAILFHKFLVTLAPERNWDSFLTAKQPYMAFCNSVEGSVRTELERKGYGREWVVVVMVDEVDALAEDLRNAEPNSGDSFFRNLRHLLMDNRQLRDHFRLVAAGVNDLSGLIRSGSPLNILAKRELGVLKVENVDELIGVGFPSGMTNEAKDRLVALTGRHPYLLQGILHKLWSHDEVDIDGGQVTRAADSFQTDHDDFRRWLNVFDDVVRAIYGLLSSDPGKTKSRRDLASAAGVSGNDIDRGTSILLTHGVIEAIDLDYEVYRITGEMFRDWFHDNAPVLEGKALENLDELATFIRNSQSLTEAEKDRAIKKGREIQQLFKESGRVHPATLKKNASRALQEIYEVVKKSSEFTDVMLKFVPILDKAAGWLVAMSSRGQAGF